MSLNRDSCLVNHSIYYVVVNEAWPYKQLFRCNLGYSGHFLRPQQVQWNLFAEYTAVRSAYKYSKRSYFCYISIL